jgi:ACS family hexuronate transporter-like MFS transporter
MRALDVEGRQTSPYRWILCALLFFATTINYIDRQLLGILAPTLQREVGWSEIDYANIVSAFQGAYALGLLACGRLIDRVGSRIGLILAVSVWSLASAAHGLASSVIGFASARFGLGLAEAGNFPASIKTVSEWFPGRERAFAIGIFNSGSNIGAIITPLMVPLIVATWGWRAAFLASGALGLMWVVAAFVLFAPIQSGHEKEDAAKVSATRVPWRSMLTKRSAWGFGVAKFLTDPIWWFYLYWAPKYLGSQYGVDLAGLAAPLVTIYLLADVGSILGGWLSVGMVRRGVDPLSARRKVMLWCALLTLVVIFAPRAGEMWLSVLLIGVAAAAHQGWSANLFATVSDMFPETEVASITGFGGMMGAIGGMLIATLTGIILQYTGSYQIPFIVCASAYIFAWLLFTRIVTSGASGV